MKSNGKQRRGGFTLVEVLIVVVILGILAATVLPQFKNANDDAKESAIIQDLQLMRGQIAMFQFEHEKRIPAAADLESKLTTRTDINGDINAAAGKFGPYINGQLPPNPFNGLRTVKKVTATPIPVGDVDGTTGWIYHEVTGKIKANVDHPLVDLTGTSQDVFDL